MIVYLITNLINNKKYVGQTRGSLDKRWKRHCWKTKKNKYYLHRAIKKYGKNNFKVEILHSCSSFEEMDNLEKKFIKLYDCRHPNGYNLTYGGQDGLRFFSPETFKKLRDASEKSAEKTRKPVESLNLKTGEIKFYKSVSEAKRSNGNKKVSVDQALRHGYVANGCLWKYASNPKWPTLKDPIFYYKKAMKFISPEGKIFIPKDPKKFCKEKKLDISWCHKIAKKKPVPTYGRNGKKYFTKPFHHKGWKVSYLSKDKFYEKIAKNA